MKPIGILIFCLISLITFEVTATENELQVETNNLIEIIYGKKEIIHKEYFTNCNKVKVLGNYKRAPLCLELENHKVRKFTVIIELTKANISRLVGTFKVNSSGFKQLKLPINTSYKGGENCLGRPIKIVVLSEIDKNTYITIINEWFAKSCDFDL